MKENIDPEIYLSIMKRFCETCDKLQDLHTRIDNIPKILEVYEYIFADMDTITLRKILRILDELSEKTAFCNEILIKLEDRFQRYVEKLAT